MRRVLIIEDEDEIRQSMVEALEECGHPAEGAANGLRALELLRKAPLPCLIILDLMMPGMDGRTFREAQLKDPGMASVPVLVISAYRDLEQSAREMRVAAWMQKPLNLDALIEAVRKHCAD